MNHSGAAHQSPTPGFRIGKERHNLDFDRAIKSAGLVVDPKVDGRVRLTFENKLQENLNW